MKPLEHKHLIVRAEILKPVTDTAVLEQWLKELVETIDMKILLGPYVVYSNMPGNRGITGVMAIETSHIALHIWDECDPGIMQLDVYTCSRLDPTDVVRAVESKFDPVKIEMKYLNRETNLTELPLSNEI